MLNMSEDINASTSSSLSDQALSQPRKAVRSYGIAIDSSKIHEVAYEEQPESLRELGVNVFDQDVFEEGVIQQVDEAIASQEKALEKQRLEKELKTVEDELRLVEHRIKKSGRNLPENEVLVLDLERLHARKDHILQRLGISGKSEEDGIELLNGEENTIANELDENCCSSEENSAENLLQIGSHHETEVERLIRLGEMTPFGSTVNHSVRVKMDSLSETNIDALGEYRHDNIDVSGKNLNVVECELEDSTSTPHTVPECVAVGYGVDDDHGGESNDDTAGIWGSSGGAKDSGGIGGKIVTGGSNDGCGSKNIGHHGYVDGFDGDEGDIPPLESDEEYVPDEEELKLTWEDDQFLTEEEDEVPGKDDNLSMNVKKQKLKKHKTKAEKKSKRLSHLIKDDGDDRFYQARIRESKLKKVLREKRIDYSGKSDEEDDEFWDEEAEDEEFEGGLKIPGVIWNRLFRYQKTGVKWLWELHCQQAGGIVGDEMGLGKTIQVIAFLAGLKNSKLGRRSSKRSGLGPVLIVCPATVLFQWVAEFHKWWPEFRVAVLHDTGSYQGPKDALINKIRNAPGILVTTYSGVRLNQDYLLPSRWDYVILDEGHIIRNPDAEITLACKQFRTAHRIVLSGSPMQNNLRELWSLFDFVFPGKLGTLPVFMQEFSVPITMGGYSNASAVQVQTAYKCACVLRDTINPYLLRRLKKDVKTKLDLPNKNEQVLFCRLTEEQTEIYKEYLSSRDVGSILSGTMKVFPGLIMLRKICNHPDLTTEAGSLWKLRKDKEMAESGQAPPDENDSEYGYWKRSGKLVVVQSLLKLWKRQKHKVLLFTQTRQMLKILEIFVKSQGYNYCRMDGTTSIASRQPLVEKFNKDLSIFVFLLTTRVGGLGVNLVGANRVILYDPDWNPGTDIQARERAWRVGQRKDVTIYRLLTTGTIEEKIYHRQIFKQFLTNRVLKDPKQRRFFKSNDLFELFTLDTSDNTKTGTETGAIFAGLGCEVKVPPTQRKGTKRKSDEVIDNASVMKIAKEKTKEILRSQFSSSKEASTKASRTDCRPSETKNSDNTQSGESDIDTSKVHDLSFDTSNAVREPPDCTRQHTGNFDEASKGEDCMDSITGNTIRSAPSVERGDVDRQSCDVGETGLDSRTCGAGNSAQTLSLKGDSPKTTKTKMKNKMKKSKKKKKNRIEGIRIGQLSHSEPYVSRKDSNDGDSKGDDDSYILKKLFKKSGVHSALQHDTIVNSGNSDHILVENEARRVAAQAAEALKRSREQCMQLGRSGLPTWTGQSGVVGSPYGLPKRTMFGPKTKTKTPGKEDATHFSGETLLAGKVDAETKSSSAPMSSTQLLARMRARNFIGGNNAGSEVLSTEKKHEETMTEVRNFIATRCSVPGRATTREILEEFRARLPVSDSAVFRAMLRTICDFDRGLSGEGFWVLKPEFSITS